MNSILPPTIRARTRRRGAGRCAAILALGLTLFAVAALIVTAPLRAGATDAAGQGDILALEDSDLIFGVVEGELQIILNLYPYADQLKALSPEGAAGLLTRTALHHAGVLLEAPEHADLARARVDLIGLSDLNEYGNADLSTIDQYGFVRLERAGGKLDPVENTIHYAVAAGSGGDQAD
jgi:hypothetical protein